MHSALAGGPHFLAHNSFLPFPSCSSWGGVLPRLLYPSASLWSSQSKSGRGCLFFLFAFSVSSALRSFSSLRRLRLHSLWFLSVVLFTGLYVLLWNRFLPIMHLRGFQCRNIKIIFHSADEKISTVMYFDFNTSENYCGIGLLEDCSAAFLKVRLYCLPSPKTVRNNTGGGGCMWLLTQWCRDFRVESNAWKTWWSH